MRCKSSRLLVVEASLGHVFGYENFLRNSVLRVSRPSNSEVLWLKSWAGECGLVFQWWGSHVPRYFVPTDPFG